MNSVFKGALTIVLVLVILAAIIVPIQMRFDVTGTAGVKQIHGVVLEVDQNYKGDRWKIKYIDPETAQTGYAHGTPVSVLIDEDLEFMTVDFVKVVLQCRIGRFTEDRGITVKFPSVEAALQFIAEDIVVMPEEPLWSWEAPAPH